MPDAERLTLWGFNQGIVTAFLHRASWVLRALNTSKSGSTANTASGFFSLGRV
jgi:hypothetical protein